MGDGVSGLVGGSMDWGGHFLRRRWSACLGWFRGSQSIIESQLRVGET
jgi:hypothetical protein